MYLLILLSLSHPFLLSQLLYPPSLIKLRTVSSPIMTCLSSQTDALPSINNVQMGTTKIPQKLMYLVLRTCKRTTNFADNEIVPAQLEKGYFQVGKSLPGT